VEVPVKKKADKHHKAPKANVTKKSGRAGDGALSEEDLDQVSGGTGALTTQTTIGGSPLQQAINNMKNKIYA
jgi:hypothetical protein